MPWIILSMFALAVLFSYWGWKWNSQRAIPEIKQFPYVSVIIPSYNSPNLVDTLNSAKALDYPNKEIIVVDDSVHTIPPTDGVTIIHNKKRIGKANALNEAVEIAKGDILYFLDSDTVTAPDVLKKLVPWFSKGVGAVSPKFIASNGNKNLLTRLISLEHQFLSALFKIHMYFGSLISFRGCGIAIKKDVLLEMGGWKNTIIEDTDMGATMVKNGYKILYEPGAIVKTKEPETLSEFKRQRFRWGKGTGFSFFKHWRFYLKNPQFGLYIFPYLLLSLAITGFLLYNTTIYLLPLASLYFIYTVSITHLIGIFMIFILPIFSSVVTSMTAAGITHFAIVTNSERQETRDIVLIIPYIVVYFPLTIILYAWGTITAIRDKKRGNPELNLDQDW